MKTKIVRYEGRNKTNPLHEVVYAVYGNRIVFSAIHRHVLSTINGAENIIKAIAKAEKIDPQMCRFFDLQTKTGYGSHRRPGDFSFSEVKPVWGSDRLQPETVSWVEGYGCEEVLRDFKYYVWGNEPAAVPRNMAVAAGAFPPLAVIPNTMAEIQM